MLARTWHMVWKEAIQFWRYKLLLLFILAFPVLNMLGAAEAVSAQILRIPTAVYDQDRSAASRQLMEMLRGSRLFEPDHYVGSQAELERLLEQVEELEPRCRAAVREFKADGEEARLRRVLADVTRELINIRMT